MDRRLINLSVPALQQSFDLIIPTTVSAEFLTALLAEGIQELSGGKYIPSGQEKLCMKDPDILLTGNQTLAESGIFTGAHLVLF